MLYLKRANFEDTAKEWDFVRNMPPDENGLTNEWSDCSYDDFTRKALPSMIYFSNGVNLPDGYVPETFLFLWNDDTIVGQFRIRHYLCDSLRTGSGHIGYFIGTQYRGKGYGKEGLRLTLEVARDIVPEDEFYLQLLKTNKASLRVMESNGGRIVASNNEHYYVRIKNPGKTSDTVFETAHLIVRKFRMEDAATLFENHSEPEVQKWIPNECYADLNEAQNAVEFFINCVNKKHLPYVYAVVLKETNELIGDVGINMVEGMSGVNGDGEVVDIADGEMISKNTSNIEIGYVISSNHRGKGYATELVKAMVNFVCNTLGYDTIWGLVMLGNIASAKVLEKNSFKYINEKSMSNDDSQNGKTLIYKYSAAGHQKHPFWSL